MAPPTPPAPAGQPPPGSKARNGSYGRSRRALLRPSWLYGGLAAAALLSLLLVGIANAGGWLIVNHPRRSDLILVLEGEDHFRPQEGVKLLQQGYAPQLWMDADTSLRTYLWTEADLARMYVKSLPPQLAARTRVRGENDLSTKSEALHIAPELRAAGIHSVLLVTSDFASHRALLEFRHEIPGVRFSMAAAFNSRRYGLPWWRQREWAKSFALEAAKLAWFEMIDRWRGPTA